MLQKVPTWIKVSAQCLEYRSAAQCLTCCPVGRTLKPRQKTPCWKDTKAFSLESTKAFSLVYSEITHMIALVLRWIKNTPTGVCLKRLRSATIKEKPLPLPWSCRSSSCSLVSELVCCPNWPLCSLRELSFLAAVSFTSSATGASCFEAMTSMSATTSSSEVTFIALGVGPESVLVASAIHLSPSLLTSLLRQVLCSIYGIFFPIYFCSRFTTQATFFLCLFFRSRFISTEIIISKSWS